MHTMIHRIAKIVTLAGSINGGELTGISLELLARYKFPETF